MKKEKAVIYDGTWAMREESGHLSGDGNGISQRIRICYGLDAVNGGLRVKLKAENYVRPLINVYYKFGPLKLPPSWGNEGKGGVDIIERNGEVLLNAYSGEREMKSGDVLNYNFELLITPFRVIDRKIKFGDRYYHGGGTNTSVKVDSAKKAWSQYPQYSSCRRYLPFHQLSLS